MVETRVIGTRHNVSIEIAAWDGAMADVDLSCACMFNHEQDRGGPQGGLGHLDALLGGRLVQLRRDGLFRGERGETALIDRPPGAFAARAVLIIGMGDPEQWLPTFMPQAIGEAVSAAHLCGAASAAFAPSLLDSGINSSRTSGVAAQMIVELVRALDRDARLNAFGLRAAGQLMRFVFDVGASHFDPTVDQFRAALAAAQ